MNLHATILGAVIGGLLFRHPLGAVVGALVGRAFDAGWLFGPAQKADPLATAYRVLDASPADPLESVNQRYRKLISQYHPDKVAAAAPEIRRIAEERSREINAAWERIQAARSAR